MILILITKFYPRSRSSCILNQVFYSTGDTTTQPVKSTKKKKTLKEKEDNLAKLRAEFEEYEEKHQQQLNLALLSPEEVRIHECHAEAVRRRKFTYDDPLTGCRVITRLQHFLRKRCCGNACRHCVYNYENVMDAQRENRVFNTSFWRDANDE